MVSTMTGKQYLIKLKKAIDRATEFDKIYLKEQYKGAKKMYEIYNKRHAEYRERNREKIRAYDRAYKARKRAESGQAEAKEVE